MRAAVFVRLRKISARNLATALAVVFLTAMGLVYADPLHVGKWKKLAEDGLHDPANPGIVYLQEPGEALSKLPVDAVGNQVLWVRALQQGLISPRTNVIPETKIRVLDQDVIMPRTGEMPMVRFPHKQHTEWLDCSNCHDSIFKTKAGATPVDMMAILSGEYCGQCHGAVAFPLTECNRCHSVWRPGTGPNKAAKP